MNGLSFTQLCRHPNYRNVRAHLRQYLPWVDGMCVGVALGGPLPRSERFILDCATQGHAALVARLLGYHDFRVHQWIAHRAHVTGDIDVLRLVQHCVNGEHYVIAAKYGHLRVLEWLDGIVDSVPFDEVEVEVATVAAENGHASFLAHALELNHAVCIDTVVYHALESGNLDTVNVVAVRAGHLKCSEASIGGSVALGNNVEVLEFLCNHTVLWDVEMSRIILHAARTAAIHNVHEFLQHILPRLSEEDAWIIAGICAADGSVECMQILVEHGVPMESELLTTAAQGSRFPRVNANRCIECIHYLLAAGCPVDDTARDALRAVGINLE